MRFKQLVSFQLIHRCSLALKCFKGLNPPNLEAADVLALKFPKSYSQNCEAVLDFARGKSFSNLGEHKGDRE